jgi:MFS family permease
MGYIMWGITTIIFGLTQFFHGVLLMAVMVVVFDCVMSFFGSMGNDCGFNAWTTDITTPENRGTLGTAISIQPVIATIVGTVAFGAIVDSFSFLKVGDQVLDYFMLFLIVGIAIIIVGVVSFFLMKESPTLMPRRGESFCKDLKKPFNFKLLKQSKLLLFVLLTFTAFFISFNVYFPHLLNYFIYNCAGVSWLDAQIGLGKTTLAGAIMALGMLLAIPLVALSGKFLNKQKFVPILLIAVSANIFGLLLLFFGGLFKVDEIGQVILLVIGTFFVGGGYMALYQALMTWVKNLFPDDMRSQFEGVRMIFFVCIPMFLGTLVGNFVVKYLGDPITISYPTGDVPGFAPNYWLFIVGAGLALITFIPILLAKKESEKIQVVAE